MLEADDAAIAAFRALGDYYRRRYVADAISYLPASPRAFFTL